MPATTRDKVPASNMPARGTKSDGRPKDRKQSQPHFGGLKLHDLEVPSGFTIKVRRPGLAGLVKEGVLESLDSLTSIVQSETIPRAEGKPVMSVQDQMAVLKDKDKINELTDMLDRVTMSVVMEPKLLKPPTNDDLTDEQREAHVSPETLRDPDASYIDQVEDEDKTFIMQFALGGSPDLARFRAATQEAVASLPAVEPAESATE